MRGGILITEYSQGIWVMEVTRLNALAQVFQNWAARPQGERFVMDEDSEYGQRKSVFEVRRQQAQQYAGGPGNIAVIPVYGSLVQRGGMMTEVCGATSCDQVSAALSDALSDDSVSQILMDFDTPGGNVYGVQELGDLIYSARDTKPIVASVNSMCASGGLWLASQCSEIYITPGGDMGSLGVYQMHVDQSKALEMAGVAISFISAGEYKTEGNPYEPMGDDAVAYQQSQVDAVYSKFANTVARGRDMSVDKVIDKFGKGRMMGAADAVKAGMADGVATFGQVVNKMRARAAKPAAQSPRKSLLAEVNDELTIMG